MHRPRWRFSVEFSFDGIFVSFHSIKRFEGPVGWVLSSGKIPVWRLCRFFGLEMRFAIFPTYDVGISLTCQIRHSALAFQRANILEDL